MLGVPDQVLEFVWIVDDVIKFFAAIGVANQTITFALDALVAGVVIGDRRHFANLIG